MNLIKNLSKYVLSKNTEVNCPVPLSVYVNKFVECSNCTDESSATELFLQHMADTDYLSDKSILSEEEFNNIEELLPKIVSSTKVTDKCDDYIKEFEKFVGDNDEM